MPLIGTLGFNTELEWERAMAFATAVVKRVQRQAGFPSVVIEPDWSSGRVRIRIPFSGAPITHQRLADLHAATAIHGCQFIVHTSQEQLHGPHIEITEE